MIRYKLREMVIEREKTMGTSIPLAEIAKETGINRVTLSKIYHRNDYNATVKVIDKLCTYFGCEVGDILEHVSD